MDVDRIVEIDGTTVHLMLIVHMLDLYSSCFFVALFFLQIVDRGRRWHRMVSKSISLRASILDLWWKNDDFVELPRFSRSNGGKEA